MGVNRFDHSSQRCHGCQQIYCLRLSFSMRIAVLLFFTLTGLIAPTLHAQREKLPPEDLDFVEKTWPTAKKTNTAIRYIIQREGQGESPKPGDFVSVLYVGKLLDGKIFDQYLEREKPFTFRIKRDQVI